MRLPTLVIIMFSAISQTSSIISPLVPAHRLLLGGGDFRQESAQGETHYATSLCLSEPVANELVVLGAGDRRLEFARVTLDLDAATMTTVVTDPAGLAAERAALESRAVESFKCSLSLDPLAPVAALAAQRLADHHRGNGNGNNNGGSSGGGGGGGGGGDDGGGGVALDAVDEASRSALETARAQGLVDVPSAADDSGEVEVVDWVRTTGEPLALLPRKLVHLYNCLHRGIGVVVWRAAAEADGAGGGTSRGGGVRMGEIRARGTTGEIYVHQRSATKKVFPAMYDMFVGGVSTAGESADVTAQRELAEELNIHAAAPMPTAAGTEAGAAGVGDLRFLFDCLVATRLNRCRVSVFDVRVSEAAAAQIRFQEEEVQGGAFEARTAVDAAAEASWRTHVLKGDRLRRNLRAPPDSGGAADGNADAAAVPAGAGGAGHQQGGGGDESEAAPPPRAFVPDGLAVWNAYLEWEMYS